MYFIPLWFCLGGEGGGGRENSAKMQLTVFNLPRFHPVLRIRSRIRTWIRTFSSDPDPFNVFRYHTQKYFNIKFSKL